MAHELVIRNGTIVDGTGDVPRRGDVAVDKGRISQVGQVVDRGLEEIDADGHVVTPGFIDGHTHMDAQLFWDRLGTNSCWHGVTTVVMGNCGFTLAPAHHDERALVVRNLERAEDISAEAMAQGMDWTWATFPEYLDAVDAAPKAINYVANVGHSALRTWAMGERAFEAEATDDEMAMMVSELKNARRAGAVGLTSSRNENHETSDDRPVASRQASWEELYRLVNVLGATGPSVLELAVESAAMGGEPDERRYHQQRLSDLAVQTGVAIMFGLQATRPGGFEWLKTLEACEQAGGQMFAQTHSRGISVILSFLTSLPFDVLPEWAEIRALPVDQQKALLRDESTRARLISAANEGNYSWSGVGPQPRKPDYEELRLYQHGLPPNPSVAEIARQRGVDPAEAMIDLALETDFEQLYIQPPRAKQKPEDLLALLRHPRSIMTFSDAGAHVSQIADASIHTHLLGHWVRNEQALPLEEAVHMLTQVPARAWRFSDRGMVGVGLAADLNIFDPETVGPEVPTLEADLPGGGMRLVQKASGFLATIVGGQVTLREGHPTGLLPGRLLRGAASPTV